MWFLDNTALIITTDNHDNSGILYYNASDLTTNQNCFISNHGNILILSYPHLSTSVARHHDFSN